MAGRKAAAPREATVLASWDRPVTPGARVAGLSLFGRLCRQLGRSGVGRVQVWTEDPEHVRALLPECPRGLEVEIRALSQGGEASPGDGLLDASCLYDSVSLAEWVASGAAGGPPEPLVRPGAPADLDRMARLVWGTANKSIAHDGVVAYFLGRPVARLFSKLLVGTAVTPNQVTVASLLVGLAAAWVAAQGTRWCFVLGAFLYWFGMVVDCIDGDLARVRLEGSRLGQWLDTVADDLSTAAFAVGMGFGLARAGAGLPWAWVGLGPKTWAWFGAAGGLGVVLGQLHVYRGLVRLGLPADTALYPWFFLGESGAVPEGWSVGTVLSQLVRRDTSSFLYILLCLAGLPEIVGLAAGTGGLVVFVLALLDSVLGPARRRAAEAS